MFIAWKSKIGEGDFCRSGRVKTNWKFDDTWWISYLYLFDADTQTVWVIPPHVVIEDGWSNYEIADAWGDKWKVLRKKSGDTWIKRCFFNSYEAFTVPVKATFYFYFNAINDFSAMFWLNLINAANTWWRPVWFYRDAWLWGNLRYQAYYANTNAWTVSSDDITNITSGVKPYSHAIDTTTLYMLETRIDSVTNKQRIRISDDLGETRFDTIESVSALSQRRLWYFDWNWTARNIQMKRVEVVEL